MLFACGDEGRRLTRLDPEADPTGAVWIDLYRPDAEVVARIEALGFDVPTLEDMEEIEVSNRLYRDGDTDVLTVILPGFDTGKQRIFGPVAFLVAPKRLVTVRYHAPRSFDTFPDHCAQSNAGCASSVHVFYGLVEEVVARLADLMEEVGRHLDSAAQALFAPERVDSAILQKGLRDIGRQGEVLAGYRLSLLSLERALTTFQLNAQTDKSLRALSKALIRDIQALIVHADFLAGRVAHVTDVTLGMVNLEQSVTSRIVSVVAVMFLPPTLVASVYGMNFENLPGIHHPLGYLIATGLMIGSALGTYLYCRWKGWL